MLRSIISMSLRFKFLVVLVAVALIVVGVGQLRSAPVDVLPEFSPPYVEIQTEALGLSAEEVEELVTLGMEQDLLNGVPWLRSIQSESMPGLSSVVLVFDPGTDVVRARQMVAERLAQAFALPHVSKPPTMLQQLSSTSRVMVVGLSSKTLTPIQMSVLARWTIAPRLLGVPGVANVAVWGQRDRQLQVLVDPKRLQDHKVTLQQVLETTGNALWVSSLSFVEASTPGTGGFIDTSNQRIGIRHLLPIVSPEGLAQVPIEGVKASLGDVATIVEDHQPLIGDAVTSDGTGLLLVIEKFPGANPLAVTKGVEDALAELSPGMTGLDMNPNVYRPADFIEAATRNLGLVLLIGLLLVLLAIAAFLFEWRAVLIGLIAIPVSFLAAGLVLYATKTTFNIMVLTGFLIAIGIVVDDAVSDVDNIARHLREARSRGDERPMMQIIMEASFETRGALVYATLILLLAVTPIFFIGEAGGRFFQPVAIAYGLAILASMVVALTITPALYILLASRMKAEAGRPSPLATRLQGWWNSVLRRLISRPALALAVAAVLTAAGLIALPFLKTSVVPSFKERDIVVHLQGAAGMSQSEMSRISGRMSEEIRAIPDITNVSAQVGRAIFGDQIVDVNSAELWVSMDTAVNYDKTISAIQEVVRGYPGLQHSIGTYLQQESNQVMPASSKWLDLRVYGDTDAGLRASAQGIQKAISGIQGITDAQINYPIYAPTLEIEVNLPAAQRVGMKPGDVRRAATTMFSGLQVGSLFEEQKVFDVVVWSTPESRRNVSDVLNLQVDTPTGGRVRLGDVAQVRLASTPSVIRHDAVKRYMDIMISVQGRSQGAVAADIQSELRKVQLPLEYHAEVLGDYASQQATFTRVLWIALAALAMIFLLLQAAYGSWRLAFLAILTLPMALSGAVFAAILGGGIVSLGTLAGSLTVLGMGICNGVLMTNHLSRLAGAEPEGSRDELVLRATGERMPSMLASALATFLALLPSLFIGDVPGLEVMRPMVFVVLGGALTTLLLDLFVLPALYLRYGFGREADLELTPVTSAAAAD